MSTDRQLARRNPPLGDARAPSRAAVDAPQHALTRPQKSGDLLVAAKGGAVVFGGRMIAWGSRFAIAVFLARALGASQYGLYSLALTIAALGAALAVLGMDSALIRYGAVFAARQDVKGLRGSLQVAIGIPALLSVLSAVGLFVLAEPIARYTVHEPSLAPLLRTVSILVPATVLSTQLAATLQGLRHIHLAVLGLQVLQPAVRFAALLALAVVGLTAETAVAASTFAALCATATLFVFLNRLVPLAPWTEARRQPGAIIRFSLPIYFSNLVSAVGENLQTLLLGAMSTIASVGIFGVANQLNLVGSIFHSALVSSSMPIFAELHDRRDRRGLEHLFQATSKWTLTLNLPFFLAALLFPHALLSLFGPEFESGWVALVIIAWGNLVNAATGTSGALLDMTGHTWVKFLNATTAVVLALGLNLLLIPRLGIVGAAISVFASLSLVNIMRLVEVLILVRVSPYNRSFLKPLGAAVGAITVAAIAAALVGNDRPILQVASGLSLLAVTYVLLLVRLGLTEEDRMILRRIRGRLRRRGKGESSEDSASEIPESPDQSLS